MVCHDDLLPAEHLHPHARDPGTPRDFGGPGAFHHWDDDPVLWVNGHLLGLEESETVGVIGAKLGESSKKCRKKEVPYFEALLMSFLPNCYNCIRNICGTKNNDILQI